MWLSSIGQSRTEGQIKATKENPERRKGSRLITFTSSSTVEHFVELLKKEDLKQLLKKIAIACIGPVTAKTAKESGDGSPDPAKRIYRSCPRPSHRRVLRPSPFPLSQGERGKGEGVKWTNLRSKSSFLIWAMSFLPFNNYQIAEKLSKFSQKKEFQNPKEIFPYLFDLEEGVINNFDVGKVSPVEFFQSLKEFFHLSLSFEEFVPIWTGHLR